ncbi:hypothetical protein LEP1GSC062_3836 [Leptospira alexanderi serovar Manhao 3 str. L 60]|uniref:Uncharacterized protein n=1 Tax=Leptospira alexanderi serovar Manhao 3 str. L 60 TaxID=1049759 RepID=V6I8V2_9LEPT|nr:hypothetical protein LEP1GSC062_3836 [Leptospira alexanderi serovar Manhao 3 str. L 60]
MRKPLRKNTTSFKVMKHLKVLSEANLLKDRKEKVQKHSSKPEFWKCAL